MADSDAKKKARQKAFYHKQRLDAEAKVRQGGLGAGDSADTLQKIGSKLSKSKDKGAQDTAKKDLGMSARYRAGVRQGPLDPNPSAAADLAGTAASFLPAGKYAGKGIKALERWGEGAARSGMKNSGKAEEAASAVSKAGARSSGKSTTTAKVGKDTSTKTRTADQAAQKKADEKTGESVIKSQAKEPTKPMAKTSSVSHRTVDKSEPSTENPGWPKSVDKVTSKKPEASSSSGSATDAFKSAKGKEARSAAWKAMSKDEQKAYQAQRGPSTASASAPKAKTAKAPKADPAASKPAAKDPNNMSDSELEAYKKTAPKDAKGRTILKSPDSAPPAAADAPSTAGKGYVRQKIAAMKAQKAQAAADAAKDAGSATP